MRAVLEFAGLALMAGVLATMFALGFLEIPLAEFFENGFGVFY